ncbi:hypothetical protein ACTJJ0_04820 [Chitinophaga sp. 22321]|uniref:Lipoprotein n=1 Tax=Chitinophaga hostae TaxID=2831022 RepID=A0ABS5J079_9BACT|nr:hypothetical protein [Chitinophaga hostae]MBS0027962.1 hypothetical protein [Chitinophaga hostae]
MRTVFISLLLFFIFSGCQKSDDGCSQYQPGNISGVRYMGTSSEAADQDGAFFDLSCVMPSSCTAINKVYESREGNVVKVGVETVYNKCAVCPEVPVTQTKTYVFVPRGAGTYYIKWQGLPDRVDTVVIR